jgi:hypothetical protein
MHRACRRAFAFARESSDPDAVPVFDSAWWRTDEPLMQVEVRFRFWADAALVGLDRALLQVIERLPMPEEFRGFSTTEEQIDLSAIAAREMAAVVDADRVSRQRREQAQALTQAERDPSPENVNRLVEAYGLDAGGDGGDRTVMVRRVGVVVTDVVEWPPMSQSYALQDLPGPREAQARGKALLLAELTPAQAKSLEWYGYFDVRGGRTGARYRIRKGDVQNVFEMTRFGRIKRGLCFAPAGNLVWGDVMLAQKTALELFEDEALSVANEFF